MPNRILSTLISSVKMFYRSKSSVFWTIAFPVILILIFGAIFSGGNGGKYNIHIQDLSDSQMSHKFIEALNQSEVINVIDVGKDVNISEYIRENSPTAVLIIPSNFDSAFIPGATNNTTQLKLMIDPTSTSANVITSIVISVSDHFNLAIAQGGEIITLKRTDIASEQFNFIDFFLPGIIALTTMTTTIFWTVDIQSRYRENGIFKKLMTTPLTRMEWLATQILWQLVVVFISIATILVVGIALYDVELTLDPIAILIIISSSALFSSMGMILARFIKEPETAGTAANAITFPMMFLSGTFFPLETMPEYLRAVAQVLPLTYVSDGLRDAMVYNNIVGATNSLVVVVILAMIFFLIGVAVSRWKVE
ncbi:MAG: ABC transporter permease [Methanomassiliicoccales archaeon]|nr:ABC transporter permease [Methanomassiliicoccales archaeon]